jgi:hypothetical protein
MCNSGPMQFENTMKNEKYGTKPNVKLNYVQQARLNDRRTQLVGAHLNSNWCLFEFIMSSFVLIISFSNKCRNAFEFKEKNI